MKYQSVIIATKKDVLELNELNILLAKEGISVKLDDVHSTIISPEKNSIGIAELEDLAMWAARKDDQIKLILINRAEKLTVEAQNSLLKLIEEPPENTLIVLATKNTRMILETIRSRCITISERELSETSKQFQELAKSFISSNYLNKLKIVEKLLKDYDNREEIGEFVLEVLRQLPKTEENMGSMDIIKKIYTGINKSVNLKLSLDLLCITTS